MQQLQVEFKNVPRNTSLVPCSTNPVLNRDESLSVQDKVLACNNPEVNQVQHTERLLQAKVYVISKEGFSLMPCSYAKSKRMVKKGAAKVIKRSPFTIQLNFKCENKTQPIVLGIDTGYGTIGFSARTLKEELISGTVKLDGKTKERLDEKRMYRKGRRNKLWYREPRWLNRSPLS
jgi:hypothetical protein